MLMQINKTCPSCEKNNTLVIKKNLIFCENPDCDFSINYACPLCNHPFDLTKYQESPDGDYFECVSCKKKIHIQKIRHLIENQLIVDHKNVCPYCNGPTIHRKDMNLSHRCFYYPQCSGQADLFGGKKESLVFLDFETTGLEIARDFIIEIGALKLDSNGCEHSFQTFVKAPVKLSQYITKLTGISDSMLLNAPDLKTGVQQLVDFMAESTLVVHNAVFDLLWLLSSTLRHDIPINNNKVICTLDWAKKQNEPKRSLKALTKKYNISHNSAHRALADASVTRELFFIFENLDQSQKPVTHLNKFLETSKNLVKKYQDFFQP